MLLNFITPYTRTEGNKNETKCRVNYNDAASKNDDVPMMMMISKLWPTSGGVAHRGTDVTGKQVFNVARGAATGGKKDYILTEARKVEV